MIVNSQQRFRWKLAFFENSDTVSSTTHQPPNEANSESESQKKPPNLCKLMHSREQSRICSQKKAPEINPRKEIDIYLQRTDQRSHFSVQMPKANQITSVPVKLLILATFFFGCSCCLKMGETCDSSSSSSDDCDAGLICGSCPANGNTRPRCSRVSPIIPTSKVNGLPFNKYSWLTTHNSFSREGSTSGTGSVLLAPTNQEDSVTDQLQNGVRGLMLDLYDFNNDIWLCHSFNGQCLNVTAFQPAINVFREIQDFLQKNPSAIITIFIEDYVKSPKGLTNLLNASGLIRFVFPLSRMPRNGGDWPTVVDMVQKNQRVVLFTSKASKEASESIAYQWNYVVENQYGDDGMRDGTCPIRSESSPMNTASKSLVLMNHFQSIPDILKACADNSAGLITMTRTCYNAAGKRWPNFIAVDFYKRSDGGGVPEAVDEVNGQSTCGCNNIGYCRANATFGTCDIPLLSPPSQLPLKIKALGPSDGSMARGKFQHCWFVWTILTMSCLHVAVYFYNI